MTIKSGFFNSDNGDRKYDAEDMNEFFDGLIAEGVFSTIGDSFIVSPSTGMQITIGSGRAWFLKSWLLNTSDAFLTLDASDITYPRIDIVAMDFDKRDTIRENSLIIVKGTASGTPTPPSLIDTIDHKQIPLAHIYVAANVTSITALNITNKVGTSSCPFVTGLLDQVDIEALLVQWYGEFSSWMNDIDTTLSQIQTGTIFDRIDSLDDRNILYRNLLINGDFCVNQGPVSTFTGYYNSGPQGQYVGVADRWKLYINNAGTWTLSRTDRGLGRYAYRIQCTTAKASADSDSVFYFSQGVEASHLGHLQKGTTDARELYLNFFFKSNKTGTFIVEIQDTQNGLTISRNFSYPIADYLYNFNWNIPAEQLYTLDLNTSEALRVNIWLVAGTNYGSQALNTVWSLQTTHEFRASSQANLASSIGNYVEVYDVQLEIGDQDPQPEFERLPYHIVLEQCQRYKEVYTTHDGYDAVAVLTNLVEVRGVNFRVPKRATPTLSMASGTIYIPGSSALSNIQSLSEVTGDQRRYRHFYSLTPAGSVTVGNLYRYVLNDLVFEAELY